MLMKRKTARPSVPAWPSGSEPNHLAADFLTAASRLIERGQERHQQCPIQRDAMSIVALLADQFRGTPSATLAEALACCACELHRESSKVARRVAAFEVVRRAAERYHMSGWEPPHALLTRLDGVVQPLIANLITLDASFSLLNDPEWVGELLARWTPTSNGARSPVATERILAELVVHVAGALEIEVDLNASLDDAVEAVRESLHRDLVNHEASIEPGAG